MLKMEEDEQAVSEICGVWGFPSDAAGIRTRVRVPTKDDVVLARSGNRERDGMVHRTAWINSEFEYSLKYSQLIVFIRGNSLIRILNKPIMGVTSTPDFITYYDYYN